MAHVVPSEGLTEGHERIEASIVGPVNRLNDPSSVTEVLINALEQLDDIVALEVDDAVRASSHDS